MKRILFVDHASRILGGAEINLIELLGEPAGWEPACACAPGSPLESALKAAGLKLFPHSFSEELNQLRLVGGRPGPERLLAGLRSLRAASRRLEEILRAFQPHAIITCTNKDALAAGPAARKAGIPVIWWVNDAFTADFFPPLVRFAFARAARLLAARVVTVSRFARRSLLALGLPRAQVAAIPNGIPLARYQAAATGRLHELLGVKRSAKIVGFVGRLTPWKGAELFLRLAARLAPEFPEVHFALLGGVFNEDEAFAAKLRRLAENHCGHDLRSNSGPRGSVLDCGGPPPLFASLAAPERHRAGALQDLPGKAALPAKITLTTRLHFVPFQANVAPLLADLSALVHCSLKPEPFGRVIIEAMAAGAPVLAARAGGVPEIIAPDQDGLLAAPGDLEDYARQLRRLLSDETLAARLREAALRTVRERFTLERVRRQFEQLTAEVT